MFRVIVITLTTLVLSACAGSGTKNFSIIESQIASSQTGKIFIYRNTGMVGLTPLPVRLNGISVGKIANKEMLIAKADVGVNYLEVDFGLSGPKTLRIDNNGEKNSFIHISLAYGVLTNELNLSETTEYSWRSLVQQ